MIEHASRPFFLFESRLSGKPARLYQNPVDSFTATTSDDVLDGLRLVEAWQQAGDHAVIIAAYEAASAFGLPVCDPPKNTALLELYRFSDVSLLPESELDDYLGRQTSQTEVLTVDEFSLRCDEREYAAAFYEVKAAIERGDTYQVNLTSAYTWRYVGDEIAWYQLLRDQQPVDYSALLALPDRTILSLSPELFYQKKNDTIITKPMKGTSKRDLLDHMRDQCLAESLKNCEKNRSENVMIVDLMRNDLNRIAVPASVEVSDLCAVETYPTVHQMVSTVKAKVDPSIGLSKVFSALFPSGSITGAPKYSTMACIQRLEQASRGIYTGAIGFVTPDNDHCFNIPIRTLCLSDGEGHLGVGGGLVHQSEVESEFFEMTLKARFFHDALAKEARHVSPRNALHNVCNSSLNAKRASLLMGKCRHVALIDHRDSFTYTLADYCVQLGVKVTVFSAYDALPDVSDLRKQGVTHVLFSPGPGHPADYPQSVALLKVLETEWPILGVCLGHQILAYAAGGQVLPAPLVMHGRCSKVSHDGRGLWQGLPQGLEVMRYHSLSVIPNSLPAEWIVDASSDDGVVMGMRHVSKSLFGLQFHPESILSEQGLGLLRSFLLI